MKSSNVWYSARMQCHSRLTRWGHYGTPVLLFPTAGGDADEAERMDLIGTLWGLIEDGRVKVYSCDSVWGAALLSRQHSPEHCAWLQRQYHEYVYREVVPAIRADCRNDGLQIVTAGASIGGYNAVAALCLPPDAFRAAIGMSGTYDITGVMDGVVTDDVYFTSPLHYLPDLGDGWQLNALRQRTVLMAMGEGKWENPAHAWNMARVLGDKGIPNRVDSWGSAWAHDWPTWREMLPRYLAEYVD